MAKNVFERDLAIIRKESRRYTANIGKTQRYGAFLHGGFAASLFAFTALEHIKSTQLRSAEHHVAAFHVEFLKPVDEGGIELEVEHLSVGKALVKLRIKLIQQTTPKVTGDVTILAAASNTGFSIDTEYHLSPPPTPVDLSKLERNADPGWIFYHFPYDPQSRAIPLSHWNLYLMLSGPPHPRIYEEWYTLADPCARITTLTLPVIADTYLRMIDNYLPESALSYAACVERAKRMVGGSVREEDLETAPTLYWTATQSLNLEIVRQLPPEGVKWIYMRAEGKSIRNGRLIAEMTILDESLEIVAIGQITELLMPAAKRPVGNETQRSEGGGVRSVKI